MSLLAQFSLNWALGGRITTWACYYFTSQMFLSVIQKSIMNGPSNVLVYNVIPRSKSYVVQINFWKMDNAGQMFLFQCKSLILLLKTLIELKSTDVSHTHSSSLTFPYSKREFKNHQSVKFLYLRNGKEMLYLGKKNPCYSFDCVLFYIMHDHGHTWSQFELWDVWQASTAIFSHQGHDYQVGRERRRNGGREVDWKC